MRITISLLALTALAACGANKAANNSSANAMAPANATIPAAVPANESASANLAAGGSAITSRPVMVGVDAELDPCPSTGRSSGTRPVTVRTAPNPAAGEADRITRAINIAICDQDDRSNPQAGWYAIVYSPTADDTRECGIGPSAGNGGVAYAGPCKSGWVRSTDIEVIAG